MSSKLTFTAVLRDQMTGPTTKATKAVRDLDQATGQAAITAGRYSQAQDRARDSQGRWISAAGRAKRATDGQNVSGRKLGSTWAETSRRLAGGATGAYRTASAVDRLTMRLGVSDKLSRIFGVRIAQTLLRLPGQAGIAATGFGSAMTRLSGFATTASSKIQSAMASAARAVGIAGTAIAGMAIYGGVNRLTALESADVKLETMGYNTGQREGIMGTVDKVVTGTPFALNDAATGAAQYLAAGVDPKDLEKRLQTTVDMAGIYDMPLGDASLIMSKILATGTLQGDEVMQLQERGMPVYRALADTLGVEQGDVKGLISEGKVTAEEFFDAIAPTVEGGAEKLGNTWKGRFANLRTALSRSAALALTPLMDPTKELFTGLTDMLKDAAPFFTSVGEALAPGIALAAEKAPEIGRALAPLGPPLLRLFGAVGDSLPGLISGFALWARILAPILGLLVDIGAWLTEKIAPHLGWIIPVTLAFGALSTTLMSLTIAAIGLKVLRFIAPLMFYGAKQAWALGKALSGIPWVMRLLSGAGRLVGSVLRFLFPGLTLVTRGLFLLRGAILAHPLLWIPLAIYAVAKAFAWLYENVEPVKDVVDGIVKVFTDLDNKIKDIGKSIEDLIREKFPQLNGAMDGMKSDLAEMDGGAVKSAIDGTKFGGNPVFTWVQEKTGLDSALENVFPWRKDENKPRHALGGWTASGAHEAIVGEEGREFVVNHYASEKLASIPGALPAISQGKLPVRPVPVPIAPAGGGQVVVQGDTLNVNIYDARDPQAVVAHIEAYMERRARRNHLTYDTPTLRGAH